MSGKNLNCDDKKIKRSSFYNIKKINNIEDIAVNDILVSKKEPHGTKNSGKYFIGYNDNDNIRPLCIKLPQMTGNARKFNENSTASFIVKDKKLLKEYTKIWETIEGLMNITFESKPVYSFDISSVKWSGKNVNIIAFTSILLTIACFTKSNFVFRKDIPLNMQEFK